MQIYNVDKLPVNQHIIINGNKSFLVLNPNKIKACVNAEHHEYNRFNVYDFELETIIYYGAFRYWTLNFGTIIEPFYNRIYLDIKKLPPKSTFHGYEVIPKLSIFIIKD